MKPEPRVFSKAQPCTKKEIWQCFRSERGFRRVQVDQAHAIIGLNVPRVMERNGYLFVNRSAMADHYELTPAGMEWLRAGIQAYARNHPSEAIPFLTAGAAPRVSRTRPAARR